MYKRLFTVICMIFVFCGFVYSQVSDETRQELINLYTLYAQSKSATERLQYIRNPELYKDIFDSRYGDRNIGYTPIRFGKCILSSQTKGIYILEEYVSANRGGRSIEILQYRYFLKSGDVFKIDWEASVCYNPVTLSKFKALKDGQIARMRCYANLTDSIYDPYFGFSIRDENTNYQFTAYIKKDSEDGLSLMEYLESGNARPVILEIQFVDSKEVLIIKFLEKGWVL
jgi:hypothetical protein